MGLRLPLFLVLPEGTHFGIEDASARRPTIWSQSLRLMSTGLSLSFLLALVLSLLVCLIILFPEYPFSARLSFYLSFMGFVFFLNHGWQKKKEHLL